MKKDGKRKIGQFVYWTPRIISILFILFVAMFSLDIFGNNYSFWQVVVGLLMHNIPTFVLIVILIISWKHELFGAVTFCIAGILLYALELIAMSMNGFEWYYLSWGLILALPAFLVGYLFYIGWKRKRN